MPQPIRSGRRYMPGLDGLRAVAVLGVIVYHLGIDALPGGLLGVSVFFTLSGYLITDLLLTQMRSGEFTLGSFWMARVRRLLPALLLMLVVIAAWVTVIGPHQGSDFRTAAAASVAYINNWWLVFREVSYFAQFDAPGPLNHLWSLSVEEQFYVVWPLLVFAGTRVVPEKDSGGLRPRLGIAMIALAVVSAGVMIALFQPGGDPSRVYYGTDTRAAELLIGAAVATMWPSQRLRAAVSAGARNTIDAVGVVGLAVIFAMFLWVGEFSSFLYRGGFVVLSIGVAGVTASVAHPASRLGPIIGCRPMRWIGARSYGIYLWHFPIIVLTTAEGSTPGMALGALQVAATLGIAALSWKFVEDPIRHGAIGRLWNEWRVRGLPRRSDIRPGQLGAAGLALLVLVAALAGFAGVSVEEPGPANGELAVSETVVADSGTSTAVPSLGESATAGADVTPTTTPGPCTSVIHVGGSTSLGLVSDEFIPDESEQISARYAAIGATTQHYEIAGGRAIIEGYLDYPTAEEAALKWRRDGYRGCWVFALGTMDAATVANGQAVPLDVRIQKMMAAADGDPVLWINVKTIATTGSWRSEVMPAWNEALLAACGTYDNMRVYDWASEVPDDWFGTDGIHQNGPGYVRRAEKIASALAKAFPGPGVAVNAPTPGDGCKFGLG